jgi:hypothetical protein
MEKEVIGYCPLCNEKLIATKLTCKNCDLEMAGDFSLNKFSYLSKEELEFVNQFLQSEGSFKEVQEKLGITYQKAKQNLSEILFKLQLKNAGEAGEGMEKEKKSVSYAEIKEDDHFVVKKIKEKLNQNNGKTTIKLISAGKEAEIWFEADGNGLGCDKIPVHGQLTWEVFVAAYNIAIAEDGELYKGYARAGKLGSEKLPINSLEGFIAHSVHGVEEGESAFSPGFIIAAILDWAGIFVNKRGAFLTLVDDAVLVDSYVEVLDNAKTFISELGSSATVQSRLSSFRQWYYFKELDGFAPSKFIGYKNMDMRAYELSSTTKMNGMHTEKALRGMFRLAEGNELEQLHEKLSMFLKKYGSQPNAHAQIHVR